MWCIWFLGGDNNKNEWEWSAVLFSVTFALCAIVFIIGCLCCQPRQKGFQVSNSKQKPYYN